MLISGVIFQNKCVVVKYMGDGSATQVMLATRFRATVSQKQTR